MSLCPHYYGEYFLKVEEVLSAFIPQISQIPFKEIELRLRASKMFSNEELQFISSLEANSDQMESLIQMICRRIRGFECFIVILMETNLNPWLVQELYNAYLKHVVAHIKQLKSTNKCECPPEGFVARLSNAVTKKLTHVMEGVDSCLYSVGTSIGFMDQTLYPTKNFLEALNNRLPFIKRNTTKQSALTIEDNLENPETMQPSQGKQQRIPALKSENDSCSNKAKFSISFESLNTIDSDQPSDLEDDEDLLFKDIEKQLSSNLMLRDPDGQENNSLSDTLLVENPLFEETETENQVIDSLINPVLLTEYHSIAFDLEWDNYDLSTKRSISIDSGLNSKQNQDPCLTQPGI